MQLMYYVIVFLLLILSSCTQQAEEISVTKVEDVVVRKIENTYATTFALVEYENYTEIQLVDPLSKEVLYRYGIGEGLPNDLIPIKSDLERVVVLSATHIGMLEAIGLTDRIVGVSDAKYVCSEALLHRINEQQVVSMGDLGLGDIESFIKVNPDLIVSSGFDPSAPIFKKLDRAGLQTFINHEWKETHPLGRAEWIKVFGVLFDKVEEANTAFKEIEERYLALKEQVKGRFNEESVLVGTLYGDEFNAPAGQSYMAKLLEDAGANYLFKGSEGVASLSFSLEDIIMNYGDASTWLNVNAKTIQEVHSLNAKFKLLTAVKQQQVYSYTKNINCFWEQSAIYPHWLLHDIIKIMHADELATPFYFYHKLE